MDQLEWSECGETLDDLLTNPRVQLPQIIKLSSNLADTNSKETLHKDQIVIIHAKETIQRLQGTDKTGKTLKVPQECPHKIRRKVAPGKEKVFETITDLAKTEPLPRFVEVKDAEDVKLVESGDRLKVVIVEKTGGVPSFIHFRSSAGKHVKLSVEESISFQLSVNDGSEQLICKLAEKSKEFPICAEFSKKKEVPSSHTDLGVFTITNCISEEVVIASAKISDNEYGVIFPRDSTFKFQVNSKLKMSKDEEYRTLCSNASDVNAADITRYISHTNPLDSETLYVLKYKKLSKVLKFDYSSDDSDIESSPKNETKSTKKQKEKELKKEASKKEVSKKDSKEGKENKDEKPIKKESLEEQNQDKEEQNQDNKEKTNSADEEQDDGEILPPNTLVQHSEQKDIMKRELKERERLAKLEKERIKNEKKKEKKEKKEREKDEKKKKKLSMSAPSSPVTIDVDEDLYIVPQSINQGESTAQSSQPMDNQQSQLAMYLMNKVKKVRDRTTSLGFKPKKPRGRLRKEDIEFISTDQLAPSSPDEESIYTGLDGDDELFSEDLYEALPCDMAYESLDLVAQAQRSLTVPIQTENSGDSGFDEIDQARITAWRDAMVPPPLPGNHPVHNKNVSTGYDDENLYEMAVDTKSVPAGQNMSAWQNFYDCVQQSTNEISSWDMEDVAKCLTDLQLAKYIDVFSDSQVDGQLLLDLDESVLNDLGLSVFESRKLRKFVFGWRPDVMRPPTYPTLKGYDNKDPSEWSQNDVVAHLKVIEINDFANFCESNQVNGELLKDICIDDSIMSVIIKSRDRKLKSVKIKNYVIDQWRPKKKGEGNYVSSNSILPPEKRSPPISKVGSHSPKIVKKLPVTASKSEGSPYSSQRPSSSASIKAVSGGDAPLIAKMKQQLEDNKHNWEQKKKAVNQM